jgi:hypothetical protein
LKEWDTASTRVEKTRMKYLHNNNLRSKLDLACHAKCVAGTRSPQIVLRPKKSAIAAAGIWQVLSQNGEESESAK